MKIDLERVRNIGIVAHIDAGKTTTTERILYYAGRTHRMGEVDDGNTITDFDSEEQERGITIYSAAVTFEWNGHTVNLIDTPGHVDFTAEVERALRVLDGAVVVFDGKEGAEAQSETVWRQATKYRESRLCFINKMDKLGADFFGSVQSLRDRLGANPVLLQLPIGAEETFAGVIDLLQMKAFYFLPEGDERRIQEQTIPDDLAEMARQWRHKLEESVAENDDGLMEKYVMSQPIGLADLEAAIRRATIADKVHPVLCGSARNKIGTRFLLDAVVKYLPSPLDVPPIEGEHPDKPGEKVRLRCDPNDPLAAYVFKIVAEKPMDLFFVRVYSGVLEAGKRVLNVTRKHKENVSRMYRVFAKRRESIDEAGAGDIVAVVGLKDALTGDTLCDPKHPVVLERIEFPETVISMAIEPKWSADHDKLGEALRALSRQDPTFEVRIDPDTGQTLISGMGELHLEVIVHRLARDMNVQVNVGKPRVSYRETIVGSAEAEGRFIRQAGGRGHYGVVKLTVEPYQPAPGEQAVRFENRTRGGVIRPAFIPSVEAGVREAAKRGVVAGFAMINVKATLLDGQEHQVDSSEVAFENAARIAFEDAVGRASPVVMEPVMKLELSLPEDYFGAVTGDLNARRAMIVHAEMRGDRRVIQAEVPLREMVGYATSLRGLTQGRASWSMEPLRYEVAPPAVAEHIKATAW
jgi:elongation factor G